MEQTTTHRFLQPSNKKMKIKLRPNRFRNPKKRDEKFIIPPELEYLAKKAAVYESSERFDATYKYTKAVETGAFDLYTGRPEEIDAACAEIIKTTIRGGMATGRRCPGRKIELDFRFPKEDVQHTFMHEVGHNVYDFELSSTQKEEWKSISKREWDNLSESWKKWGGYFAISNNPPEDFAETYAAWFTRERKDKKWWTDLPESYKAFMLQYFDVPHVFSYEHIQFPPVDEFWEVSREKYKKL